MFCVKYVIYLLFLSNNPTLVTTEWGKISNRHKHLIAQYAISFHEYSVFDMIRDDGESQH